MTRQDLADYITGQYAALLAAAGQSGAIDDLLGYGPALDAVMRLLGLDVASVTLNPTIPVNLEADALLLTRYYALDWLLGTLATLVDERTADQDQKKSQRFKQVTMLLERAKAQVPPQYGVEAGDFELGRINLDYLEPELYPTLVYP